MNPYATNKAIFFADRLRMLKHGEHPAPVHMQLILTNACNADCGWCAYRMDGYTSNQLFEHRDHMTTQQALKIVGNAADLGVKAVQFTGGGDPTMHPGFAEVMTHAQVIGLDTAIVTNGIVLRQDVMAATLRSTWCRVSLNAARAETWAETMRVKVEWFDRVLANVKELCGRRDDCQSPVYIGISFVVTHHNWHEIHEAAILARELGADGFRIAAMFSEDDDDYYATIGDEARELAKAAEAESTARFKVINNLDTRRADLVQGPPDYQRCAYQHLTTYVGADLQLYRCCLLAYNKRGHIGDLGKQSFTDAWHAASDGMRTFDARGCKRCQFNDRNRQTNAMIDGLPDTHETFI